MNLTHPKSCRRRKLRDRRGATLIDVATGSMLLAVMLVPSVHLLGEARKTRRRLQDRDTILFEASRLINETCVTLSDPSLFDAAATTPIDRVQAINVGDGADLTARVRVAEDPTVGSGQLLTITVDVWIDENGNARWDTEENLEVLRTQRASP